MSDEIVTEGGDETATVDAFLAEAGIELPSELTEGEPETKEDVEPKEEPKPKDPKAQEEKRKEEIRAKRVADHLRREAQFRKQTEEFKRQAAAEAEQLSTHYQQLSTIKSQMEEMYESAQRNPVQWLRDNFGVTDEQLFDIMSRGGEAPPDHVAAQLERRFNERLAQLEGKLTKAEQARIDALREREAEQQQRQAQAQAQAQVQARVEAQQGFLQEVRGNADAYPELQMYEDSHLLSEVATMVDMLTERAQASLRDTGDDTLLRRLQTLSYNDVATALQEGVAGWHQQIRGGPTSKTKPGAQQSAAPPRVKSGPPVVTRRLPAKPELEQTLSNSMSASRGSAKNIGDDVDYDALKAELIRDLERNARG